MKKILPLLLASVLCSLLVSTQTARAQGTALTYQGRLNDAAGPANGTYDFQFTVRDAPVGGNAVGVNPLAATLAVSNGLFTATLDPGANVFTGADRWLEIAVRTNGAAAFTTLSPRQKITATPYAVTAATVTGSVGAGQVTGTLSPANIGAGTITGDKLAPDLGIWNKSGADISYSGGSVGVGTTSPAEKLDVAGTVKATAFIGDGSQLTGIAAPPPGMVFIPAGPFTMGDTLDSESDATPVSVTVSAFYMDVNPVSLSQWQSVYYWATGHGYGFVNAGAGKAVNHPVQKVNWYDCVKWCNARSEQAGKPPVYYTDAGLTQVYKAGEPTVYANWAAKGYRLPTEAEWEKAARGGSSGQRFPWGNVINQNLANYYGDTTSFSYDLGPNGYNAIGSIGGTSPATSPVGSFAPNGYGLNDMAGNVFGWCWDRYGTPYAGGIDPHGPASGSVRVLRGGNWLYGANIARCARRFNNDPVSAFNVIGFRSVLPRGQ